VPGPTIASAWRSDSPFDVVDATTRIASNNTGSFIAAWTIRNTQNINEIWSSIYTPTQGWSISVLIGYDNAINLAIDNAGNAIITWLEATQIKSKRYDVATGWAATLIVSNITYGSYEFASSKVNGNTVVAWREYTNSVKTIKVRYFDSSTGWGNIQSYSDIVGTNGYDVAINDNEQAVLAWGNFNNNEYYFVYAEYSVITGWTPAAFLPVKDGNSYNLSGLTAGISAFFVELDNNRNITMGLTMSIGDYGIYSFATQYNRLTSQWSRVEDITHYYLPEFGPGGGDSTDLTSIALGKNNDILFTANEDVYRYAADSGARQPDTLEYISTRQLDVSTGGSLISYQSYNNKISANHYWEVSGAPNAKAGKSQRVVIDSLVTLDGSNSIDDNSIISYQWTQVSGVPMLLNTPNSASTTFTAYPQEPLQPNSAFKHEWDVNLMFKLQVIDNEGMIDEDTVRIVVDMKPPVIVFGPELTVNEGESIQLDATGSTAPGGTIEVINWFRANTSQPVVTFINGGTLTPTLTTSLVNSTQIIDIGLQITDNHGLRTTAYTKITVVKLNTAPIANAGTDSYLESTVSTTINLNGTLSSDSDGTIVSYQWSQASGQTGATLSNANLATATATFAGLTYSDSYTFILTVTDNAGATHTDTVTINPQTPTGLSVTGTFISRTSKGKLYFDGDLSASAAGTIYYQLTGPALVEGGGTTGDWFVYTGPITIKMDSSKVSAVINYYANDTNGNLGALSSTTLN